MKTCIKNRTCNMWHCIWYRVHN